MPEEGVANTTVSPQTSVFAFPFEYGIYLSFSIEAPHTAALTLLDKEVTESITKSSLFQPVYKNNSLDFKEKEEKNSLSKFG